MNIPQSQDDLQKYLREQIQFLKLSCDSYDNGYSGESKRLAVTLRVLLHDTNSSHSLLNQLDKKNILFYDTTNPDIPGNMLPHTGLISMQFDSTGVKYVPLSSTITRVRLMNKKISFKDWWDQIVIRDNNKNMFSRKNLVLSVVNKQGGAHVDPNLDQKFADLTKFNSLGWIKECDGTPLTDAELASIRQIAFEVLKSLQDEFPKYF